MSDAINRMAIREELTDEWQKRGIQGGRQYSLLTSEISRATFGVTPREHKSLKGLQCRNLRDHMTNLEQTFSLLGEALAMEVIRRENARGFRQIRQAARRGGAVAGAARRRLEREIGRPVVSAGNQLLQSK